MNNIPEHITVKSQQLGIKVDYRVDLSNVRALYDVMESLDPKVKGKFFRDAHRKAAKQIKNELIILAPDSSLNQAYIRQNNKGKLFAKARKLKKNISISNDRYSHDGILVGPNQDAFYARFLEFGTEERATRTGAKRGKIQQGAHNWIIETYDAYFIPTSEKLASTYEREIINSLNKKLKSVKKIL